MTEREAAPWRSKLEAAPAELTKAMAKGGGRAGIAGAENGLWAFVGNPDLFASQSDSTKGTGN